MLQKYLPLGIKLTKIHRILKFKQLDWLKIYLDFNTDKRMAKVLKRMNNSAYGKTIENLRERINVRLIISAKDYKKYVSEPRLLIKIRLYYLFCRIHDKAATFYCLYLYFFYVFYFRL